MGGSKGEGKEGGRVGRRFGENEDGDEYSAKDEGARENGSDQIGCPTGRTLPENP